MVTNEKGFKFDNSLNIIQSLNRHKKMYPFDTFKMCIL